MVNSEYTISPVQFTSYGFFIIAILLKVILLNKESKDRFTLWMFFIYLVAFSMAISVFYPISLDYATYFYSFEFLASVTLVFAFTVMTISLFKGNENLFSYVFFIMMVF